MKDAVESKGRKCLNCKKPRSKHIERRGLWYCNAVMDASAWGTFRDFRVNSFGLRVA